MSPHDLPEQWANRIVVASNDCWHWTGYIDKGGYSVISGRSGHRAVYTTLIGPIPARLTLDHVCHNADTACRHGATCLHRRCVNPAHLEPVTAQVNIRRAMRDTCGKGHPFHDAYIRPDGTRVCRACRNEHARRAREAKQAPLIVQLPSVLDQLPSVLDGWVEQPPIGVLVSTLEDVERFLQEPS